MQKILQCIMKEKLILEEENIIKDIRNLLKPTKN